MTRVPSAGAVASSAPVVNVNVTVGTVAGAGGLRDLASELATHIDRHLGKQAQLAGAMRGGS